MALKKKGRHSYGESRADLHTFLQGYSAANGYAAERMEDLRCGCGAEQLNLLLDDEEGAAVQSCPSCQQQAPLGDSAEFLAEANLGECECPCGGSRFEVTTGVAFYRGSTDVRWFYVGCRCPACGLVGCYGDWKTP